MDSAPAECTDAFFPESVLCAPWKGLLVSFLTHGSGGNQFRLIPWPCYLLAGLFYFCTSVVFICKMGERIMSI